ncbi:hypothetical protein AAOGI_41400 [Agarivorans albus]
MLFLMLLIFSAQPLAIESAVGVVQKVKVFSLPPDRYNPNDQAMLAIYVNELPGACGSNEKRIAIGSAHPLFDAVTSIAMVSKTTKTKAVVGYLGSCSIRSNAWDFSFIELLED